MIVNQPSLKIPSDLKELARARQFVAESAAALGAGPLVVDDLVLATDEIVTNSIRHGYQGEGGTIEIKVRTDGDCLEIRVTDSAAAFDPTTVPPPDLSVSPLLRRPGGLGIYLARKLTDAMTYRRTPDGRNELALVKRVS
jgi:serine/threonine-protein kinase RsbW